jgi:mRNA interferase MazF
VIAPMTTGGQPYPWRIPCRFQQRAGFVALDWSRTVRRERLVKRLGRLHLGAFETVLEGLQEMVSE